MKTKCIKIIAISLALIILCGSFMYAVVFVLKNYKGFLEEIQPQGALPCYMLYDTMTDGDYSVDIRDMINKNISAFLLDFQVVTKKEDRYYLVYSYHYSKYGEEYWCIASFDKTEKLINHYEKVLYINEVYYQSIVNDQCDLKDRIGFFYEGSIFLTDYETVIEYNISTDKTTEHMYSEFVCPDIYRVNFTDNLNLEVTRQHSEYYKHISLAEIALTNIEIKKIYDMRDKDPSDEDDPLREFFTYATVRFVGDKIYIQGVVYNSWGYIYNTIIEYDLTNDMCKYLGYVKSQSDFYVVV